MKHVGRDNVFTEQTRQGRARRGAERTEAENIADEVKVLDSARRFNPVYSGKFSLFLLQCDKPCELQS